MAHGIDRAKRITAGLMAALVVISLAVPVCMTLACPDQAMSGPTADMGGGSMRLADCVSTLSHDGLLGVETGSAGLLVTALALTGIVIIATRWFAPPQVHWSLVPAVAISPPPPLDPLGERFLI